MTASGVVTVVVVTVVLAAILGYAACNAAGKADDAAERMGREHDRK